MSSELVQALVTVAFGALAGGLTNTVAIWMLFHPYEAPKLFGRWKISFLQGAVPKNQPRLASAIGRTVGGKLLTEEDLARTFTNREFRAAFDERLEGFLDTVLHKERGSLRELVPDEALPQVEALVEEVVDHGVARLEEYVASEAFEEMVEDRAGEIVEAVAEEPIGGLLTPAREEALANALEEWLAEAVESDDFREAVDDYLDRAAHKVLEPGRTFEEILPLGLVGSLEKAISGYLPLAIQRLGSLLEDQDTRAKFEGTIHDLLHRFMRDLRFHQRVVARLIVTEDTVDRVLDTIEAEGAERISEMLREESVQDAMAREVNDAIVDFLRRPVTSVFGDPGEESVVEARGTLADWLLNMARDPATRSFLVEKLDLAMEKAGARTWGDLFERVPPEKVSSWIVAGARSEAASRLYRGASERLADAILERPIGTPADWLPRGASERIEAAVADPLWSWLQTQVPAVVERIDVARRVEQKVLEFPTPRMEELVRKVTDRELRMIVRLGYLLGAVIGSILVVVDAVMG